eukprot:Skav230006  [mRNA]  locus=scaffold1958:88619:97019:+ [translate_table: standard]
MADIRTYISRGEPSAFRSSRSFALLLPNCIQVIRLNFKSAASAARAPQNAMECCAQLAQMSQATGSVQVQGPRWSFDDVGVPNFEEQRRHWQNAKSLPPATLSCRGLATRLGLVPRGSVRRDLMVTWLKQR